MSKPGLIFLDLETSGLDPVDDEPIEFGIVGPGAAEWTFSVPFDEAKASPEALKVNGWGQREFAPLIPDARDAAVKLWGYLGGNPAPVLVGNAVHFDASFVREFIRRHAPALNPEPWDHRLVDLKSLAAGRIGVDPRSLTSAAIGRHFGVPLPDDAHTAIVDARWNRDLFYAMGLYLG